MKTRLVKLADFKGHPHPASKLFRLIELQTIYNNTKGYAFKYPSMDLGGGDGYLSSILFNDRFTYSVDNNEANDVKVAIKKKRYKKVLIESAEHMSLHTNSLNFVFSNSVIEHIPDNESVLSEVARVLKRGGSFVFTSPSHLFKEYLYVSNLLNDIGLGILGNIYKNRRNSMLNHYHTYSHIEWNRRLKKHGLLVKKYAYYISKDTLRFWDKLALEVRIKGIFDKKVEQKLFERYKNQIENLVKHDQVKRNHGASVFIWAIKK